MTKAGYDKKLVLLLLSNSYYKFDEISIGTSRFLTNSTSYCLPITYFTCYFSN